MPFYDFNCPDCGAFELRRAITDRALPADCPTCGSRAERLMTAPNLSVMNATNRRKWAINERSKHEPKTTRSHTCSSGCGCGRPRKNADPTKLQTSRAGARPWMLGH